STTITPDYCSLQWMVTSGVAISNSTAMNPTFTVSTLGTFSITLMVSNANGTTTVVNAITTNTCLDVAVKNNSAEIADVQLSPNPTNGDVKLNIYAPVSTAAIVSVYDLTGKSVIPTTETTLGNGKNNVDLKTDDLQNGIYFVTVSSSKGKKTFKALKPWLAKMDVFFKALKTCQAYNTKPLQSETEKIFGILKISANKVIVKKNATETTKKQG